MSTKLHVLLAKTEHSASPFKKMFSDFLAFFKGKQGEFKGVKKTYEVRPGMVDEPSKRGNVKVVTTVDEKLKWLEENAKEHIDNVFSVEATNASGRVTCALIVDGKDFGELSSLELLKLKSLLESENFEAMYANIPVRSDAEIWTPTTNVEYKDRAIWEKPQVIGTSKSVMKESYILTDPNIKELKDTSKYTPVVNTKDTVIELGDYTVQEYSGEFSHLERASILKRRSQLLGAVIEALKIANEAETVRSQMTSEKLFGFLHRGTF